MLIINTEPKAMHLALLYENREEHIQIKEDDEIQIDLVGLVSIMPGEVTYPVEELVEPLVDMMNAARQPDPASDVSAPSGAEIP